MQYPRAKGYTLMDSVETPRFHFNKLRRLNTKVGPLGKKVHPKHILPGYYLEVCFWGNLSSTLGYYNRGS